MPQSLTEQETIATILVNQKIMRNGSPPIVNVIDLLPAKQRDEIMDDAQAVIDGLNACRIPSIDADAETLRSDREALLKVCICLLAARAEKESNGESDLYHTLKVGNWERLREVVAGITSRIAAEKERAKK